MPTVYYKPGPDTDKLTLPLLTYWPLTLYVNLRPRLLVIVNVPEALFYAGLVQENFAVVTLSDTLYITEPS